MIRKPDYYDRFHCIGGKCTDTCCAGWEIEVDEESCSRYQNMEGPLGERIRKAMTVTEEEAWFALKHGRCPFLNRDNLCDIIIEAGESEICDICREHPRFYNWYGSDTEVGLGMCCEEAQRLMFSDSSPAGFVSEPDGADGENEEEDEFLCAMRKTREAAFSMIQNRKRPLRERILRLIDFTDELQEILDTEPEESLSDAVLALISAVNNRENADITENINKDFDTESENLSEPEQAIRSVIGCYRELESLDPAWPQTLKRLEEDLPVSLAKSFRGAYPQTEWEYEHLMIYFLNRYFLEAVYDMDVYSKARFGITGLLMIRLAEIDSWKHTDTRSAADRDRIIRMYSKEIEYCPENVAKLVDLSWDLDAFASDCLKKMAAFFL